MLGVEYGVEVDIAGNPAPVLRVNVLLREICEAVVLVGHLVRSARRDTELQRYNTRNGFTTSERYFHIQYCYTARTKEKLFCGTYFLVCLCLLTRSS